MQVGEKLAANNTAQLAEAFASRLKRTYWDCTDEKASMLRAWLPLSKGPQQLVFSKLGVVGADEVFSWPMPLQQVPFQPSTRVAACWGAEGLSSSSFRLPRAHDRSPLHALAGLKVAPLPAVALISSRFAQIGQINGLKTVQHAHQVEA